MVARLNDAKKTELAVSRDRVRTLKERLGLIELHVDLAFGKLSGSLAGLQFRQYAVTFS